MRPDADAAGGVDRLDRLGDGGGLAQAEGGAALDQVGADQRADVVDVLLAQPRGVGGRGQDGFGQVGAPDRLAGVDALGDRGVVELQALLAQSVGHAQGAALAVGEEVGEGRGESGVGVVDQVAEDVQFARQCRRVLRRVVDRGDLHGGHDAHPKPRARVEGLGDAGDGVVVGERQQLDAGLGGALRRPRRPATPRRSGSSGIADRRRAASASRAAYAMGSRMEVSRASPTLRPADPRSGRPAACSCARVGSAMPGAAMSAETCRATASRRERTAAW